MSSSAHLAESNDGCPAVDGVCRRLRSLAGRPAAVWPPLLVPAGVALSERPFPELTHFAPPRPVAATSGSLSFIYFIGRFILNASFQNLFGGPGQYLTWLLRAIFLALIIGIATNVLVNCVRSEGLNPLIFGLPSSFRLL